MASCPADPLTSLELVVRWAVVGIPLAWGVLETLRNAVMLFE
jgi:hypothetical protein